ncbi:DUF1841 family protein [Pseudonocardia acidicola]|uniref:DUF1841 family protein n=1 Tax=Pseudonocardia acidicola TaxID=2724939 RepID=A0ABX1SDM3_9PSEU|nr:DUF1841 family protein [Pseudonocardia acidicola]NMH99650.1 DUF1841 family protein [Pseudonocardia acidicola]
MFAQFLRDAGELTRITDPLDAELFVSGLVGTWWNALPAGAEDADVVIGGPLVDYAARRRTPTALAFLRAMAVLGNDAQRERALAGAEALAAAGVAEPGWATALGAVTVGECWTWEDCYGDQVSVLCGFSHGGDRPAEQHSLLVLVDHNLGSLVKDATVLGDPAAVIAELRREFADEPMMTISPVSPAEVRRLVEPALAMTDMTLDPPVAEDFASHRALAHARMRALPPSPAVDPVEVAETERAALVAEFLASPEGRALPDREAAEYSARLLVDYGSDYDDGKPVRVSPTKMEIFLLDFVPSKVVLDAADREALPDVVAAWSEWAAERNGLPEPARAELTEAVAELGQHFAQAYDEGSAGPAASLLSGLEGLDGRADLQDALNRRLFAMPLTGGRVGEEDFPHLDASDPDERRMLIISEHPEYQSALDDPAFSGEIDGVNPRLHVSMHEIVASQLWDDDPPEAWVAARRLLDDGYDRHEILHHLASLVAPELHAALTERRPVDVDGYRRALSELAEHGIR